MAGRTPTTPRRDAQRNRARLVEVAKRAFLDSEGPVPLETVAAEAGVGIGTLYRHFGSRQGLVEAVYGSELAELCDGAARLLRRRRPASALRAWMGRYADFVATKRGMAEAVREAVASGAITSTQTRRQLAAAVQTLLAAGAEAGDLRSDVSAEDVVASLAALVLGTSERAQTDRMLDLLVDGLRR